MVAVFSSAHCCKLSMINVPIFYLFYCSHGHSFGNERSTSQKQYTSYSALPMLTAMAVYIKNRSYRFMTCVCRLKALRLMVSNLLADWMARQTVKPQQGTLSLGSICGTQHLVNQQSQHSSNLSDSEIAALCHDRIQHHRRRHWRFS